MKTRFQIDHKMNLDPQQLRFKMVQAISCKTSVQKMHFALSDTCDQVYNKARNLLNLPYTDFGSLTLHDSKANSNKTLSTQVHPSYYAHNYHRAKT